MTTDDIARILAALHDTTPEKVRAIIEHAEKLRGLVAVATPQKAAEPVTAPPQPAQAAPATRSGVSSVGTRNGASAAIFDYLQTCNEVHLRDIAAATKLEYGQASNALMTLCRSGRAERVGVGIYRAGKVKTPPMAAPGRRPKSVAPAAKRATPRLPPSMPPIPPAPKAPKAIAPPLFVTGHARDRWAEHHDDVSDHAIISAWLEGVEVDQGIAAQVTQVAKRGRGDSAYRVSPDRRGMFVTVKSPGYASPTLVTYLRFTEAHVQWFLENYPIQEQATTTH